MPAHRDRGLGKKAYARAGQLGERLRESMQLRSTRMLLREIAEKDALAFPAQETGRDRRRDRRRLYAGKRARHGLTGRTDCRDDDLGERTRQRGWRDDCLVR